MYDRTIMCLANSRKPPSGRCIAGKSFDNGKSTDWIRPISARSSHEVSEEERRYESGDKAHLLDIIEVPLLQASPTGHQIENHVLDDKYYWEKKGVATWQQILAAEDAYDASFWRSAQSTFHGSNDKVAAADTGQIGTSLKLVIVPKLSLLVRSESGYEGNPARRRVRAQFAVKNRHFLLCVTDPEIEETYLQKGNGTYELGQAALCVSLAEVWNGFAFRVVASIITPERCGGAT
jgi:hypothetical protein